MIAIIRKLIAILLNMLGVFLLIFGIGFFCVMLDFGGFGTVNSLHVDFIDLSTRHPKDKKTGIELVSIKDGQVCIEKIGQVKCLKEGESCLFWGLQGRFRLLFISQESGEIVLEKTRCRTLIRFRDHVFGEDSGSSYEDDIKKQGWACLTLTPEQRVSPDLGIELISIETNGATIRMLNSKEMLYTRNGAFFNINKLIRGVDKLQLVQSSTNKYDNGVLLRAIAQRQSQQ